MLRQQGQDRRQYRLICPCVPLCRAGRELQGKAIWSEFAPILGKEKKEGIGNQYLPKGTLPDVKNTCR